MLEVTGKNSSVFFKEAGVHRIQRVPVTDSRGKRQTSTVAVVVLPAKDRAESGISKNEIKLDVFCASGCGGQNINRKMKAVRVTHLPTSTVVVCQDERSYLQNKNKALDRLQEILDKKEQDRVLQDASRQALNMIGSMERSEHIRNYNFIDNRVKDKRFSKTFPADIIMAGSFELLHR